MIVFSLGKLRRTETMAERRVYIMHSMHLMQAASKAARPLK